MKEQGLLSRFKKMSYSWKKAASQVLCVPTTVLKQKAGRLNISLNSILFCLLHRATDIHGVLAESNINLLLVLNTFAQ